MPRKIIVTALSGCLILLQSTIGMADQNCTISTPNRTLNFGTYNPAFDDTNTTTLTFACSGQPSAYVYLTGPSGPRPTYARSMKQTINGKTYNLDYNIYKTSGYLTPIGKDSGAGIGFAKAGSTNTVTFYGRIPAGQTTLPAGTYTDSQPITIEW